jgi:hypothetical protein
MFPAGRKYYYGSPILSKKIPHPFLDEGFVKRIRRRPTLPPSRPGSTIGAEELNCRVRNGNGCSLLAIATENRIYQKLR